MRVTRMGLIAATALTAAPMTMASPIEPAQTTAPVSSPASIPLAALGYRDGLAFQHLDGHRDLFFRVPPGAASEGARLILPYQAAAASDAKRTLTVTAGNQLLKQVPIIGDGIAEVPVPASAIENGTLHATLDYTGGENGNRCLDERTAADHLRLAPEGGLALAIAPGTPQTVATAAALVARKPLILLPASPTPAQAAAALTVVAARGGGALAEQSLAGAAGTVRIAGAGAPALQAADGGLSIGGADPAAAARAAFSGYADMLAVPSVDKLAVTPHRPEGLRFADLGADPRAMQIGDEGGWTVALPASRLPAGQTVRGLVLDVAAVPDGSRPATLSVWMNGVLLGSAPLAPDGRTRLRVDVPEGVVHSLNGIEVRLSRAHRTTCDEEPRQWPAQLLGSSRVLLGKAGKIAAFHDFATAGSGGVTVVVPDAAGLKWAAPAVAGLFGADVPIRVAYGAISADGPVLYVGDAPPPGSTPPLRQQGGRMMLASDKGELDLDLPQSPSLTVAQMVEAGGRPILWIRPAPSGVVPATLWLDDGDVALAGPDGAITALSSTDHRLAPFAELPDPRPWWLPSGHWLAVAIGLLIALLVVAWSFGASVKRAKPGQEAAKGD